MKVLIVEDETAASENLTVMLQEIDNTIEVLHVTESVEQTYKWLCANEAPDLIFMDIHLSDGSAFALFDQTDVQTPIVFTTAYDQYALEAFRVNSIDYLLKPIKTDELARALDKYRRWSKTDVMEYMEKVMRLSPGYRGQSEYKNSILVPYKDRLIPVNLDDVVCFYSTERKTQVFMKDNTMLDYNKSLDSIICSLAPNRFFRANKQYIVAKDYVREIVIWFDNRLLVQLPVKIPEPLFVSKNKASEFKNWMTR